ncbi:MAG: hypothetical protein ACK41D_04340 [Rubricoccaceae bacterium]
MLYLPLAVLIVASVTAIGYVAYLVVRGRRAGGAASPPAAASEESASELRALRTAIETLVDQQQMQGETHRQQVNQRLERVGHRMDEVGHQVDGLRNELRHEVRRRDAELEEIRQQIEAVARHAGAPVLSAGASLPALPEPLAEPVSADAVAAAEAAAAEAAAAEADPETAAAARPPAVSQVAPVEAARPEAAETDADWLFAPLPVQHLEATPAARAARVPGNAAGFPPPPAAPAAAEISPAEISQRAIPAEELVGKKIPCEEFVDQARRAAAPEEEAARAERAVPERAVPERAVPERAVPSAPAAPARPEPPLRLAEREPVRRTPRRSIFVPMDDFFGAAPPAPVLAPDAASPPLSEDADDLTVISSIDAGLQQRLYRAGVTSLEEIAHWSRADARRLAETLQVSEEVIMNQWVFEAQAALYERYARTGAL